MNMDKQDRQDTDLKHELITKVSDTGHLQWKKRHSSTADEQLECLHNPFEMVHAQRCERLSPLESSI